MSQYFNRKTNAKAHLVLEATDVKTGEQLAVFRQLSDGTLYACPAEQFRREFEAFPAAADERIGGS